jgi:ankyrin repeat protein
MTNLIPERIISKEEERMIIENIENYINKLSDDEESSDEDSSSLGELIEESGENVEYVESSSDSEEESSSEEESDDSESSEDSSCEEDSDEEDNFNEYLNCSPYDTARYNTKLMEAVISNNTNQMMKELENCKYDSEYINEENDIGWTALFIACINSGQEKLVNGVNEGGSGWSNINVVKLLLDNCADPNHQDNDGDTVLVYFKC